MVQPKKDIVSVGAITGFILPAILVFAFLLYSSPTYGSVMATAKHFQNIGILYKIVSVSLMPGVGLFFLWSKQNKLNQARGTLLTTMFYGILVLVLYMS